ncbi:ArsR/SmtB family transcription factor [Saccharomonospora marina]|uniref:ArsR/SmtB family transcription factor n=1 Tax=Saccharomonospora marina TaxID=632569 RepID=UPI000592CEF9|nr:metalloregulator ArsR/SmtB family transcription factor [Saccharomonospora marina]
MEQVFKALADSTRRDLLDELFQRDGQSLNALASRFAMTRVAVAKHLRLLEEAGLVVSHRRGRQRLHFLNPVPIRLVHDRWVSKYTETWAAGLVDLKRQLEAPVEKMFEIFIRTTPQRLWQAITDPDTRARFQFGARVESDWTTGSPYRVSHEGVGGLIEGENLEVDPPWRLVQSYHAIWDDDIAAQRTSRVTWQIEQVGDSCRLVVRHDQLPADADEHLYGGWPMILSGLKTWLETGTELTTPGSLMYGGESS